MDNCLQFFSKNEFFWIAGERNVSFEKAALLSGFSTLAFKALYYKDSEVEEEENYLYQSPSTSFAAAWADDEPEYTDDDIKYVNPDYEPG